MVCAALIPSGVLGQAAAGGDAAVLAGTPWTLRLGPQTPDLIRYNRVEGLSVGGRLQLRPRTAWGPLTVTAEGRLPLGTGLPSGRLVTWREGSRHRLAMRVYHEVAPVEAEQGHLRLGNSLTALLFGRDDGDYYRRVGAAVSLTPPVARGRRWWAEIRIEGHRPVTAVTDFSVARWLDPPRTFREGRPVLRVLEIGGAVGVRPEWGQDPRKVRGSAEVVVEAATGTFDWIRGSAGARLVVPVPGFRVGGEVQLGVTGGSVAPQRLWRVGGPSTLRGYAPATLSGKGYGAGRVWLARPASFGDVRVFADHAWAGSPSRWWEKGGLSSVGGGFGLADGLIRVEAAWGLARPTGFRVEAYLDGIG